MLGTVRALHGEGVHVVNLMVGDRVRKVENVNMLPGGPLTGDRVICYASVNRAGTVWVWHWNCRCGESGTWYESWEKAYRAAYIHVRLNRLLDLVSELEQEMEIDCE